ncbi:MAG: prepilin-type N-terminal cleavage/methylation domain-containing protein [Candidatus Omnitrophica bacterium]|nr:prepilin-type N-terminal cleavage/methylation domain-containing protein [Candidatus Omnitrophota bacterium]MCM8799883.1 prepilin-type N-terminal cleavage/methylation domain-containing protein [Candidatus Omnitrophota bacterium]
MKKNALTLIEVVVSLVILSITIAGTSNLFVSARRYIRHSRCRIQAVNLARYILDSFPLNVRQDAWVITDYNNALKKGTHTLADEWMGFPNIRYRPEYIATVPSGIPETSAFRKIKLTIRWIEPAFWISYLY